MKLLLITGLPASGKSTLAQRLSQRYGLPLIAKDAIKEPLLDVLGADTPAASRKLSDASFAVLFALAREMAQARTSFILEGNFRPGEHEGALQAILSAYGEAAVLSATDGDGCTAIRNAVAGEPVAPGTQLAAAGAHGVSLAQVLCRIDEARRVERLQARGADSSRHPGHGDARLIHAAGQVSDDFLSLPGERMLYEGGERTLITLDAWWRASI